MFEAFGLDDSIDFLWYTIGGVILFFKFCVKQKSVNQKEKKKDSLKRIKIKTSFSKQLKYWKLDSSFFAIIQIFFFQQNIQILIHVFLL